MIGQAQHDDFEAENLETNEMAMGDTTTGATTSAVSRLFSEGAFSDIGRKKYMIIGGAVAGVLLVLGIVFFLLSDDGVEEMAAPPLPSEDVASDTLPAPEIAPEQTVAESPPADEVVLQEAPAVQEAPADTVALSGAVGNMQAVMPSSGQARVYDETSGAAAFQWDGAADYIVFSRYSSMSPAVHRIYVSGTNSFRLHDAWPGNWYWRLESADGSQYSEIQSFAIRAPARRNIALSEPAAGASISGDSTVAWTGDEKVSYYRVEVSSGNFSMPSYRFSTVGTSLQLNGVMSGAYRLRVGGFSEVSGRWEYTDPININVQ